MAQRDDPGARQAPKGGAKRADRENRRAAALRANLRRRKAQHRARADDQSSGEPPRDKD
jgi:hypothetical protein